MSPVILDRLRLLGEAAADLEARLASAFKKIPPPGPVGLDRRLCLPDQVFLRSSLPLPGEIIPEPFLDEEPEVSTIGSIGFRPATRLGEDG